MTSVTAPTTIRTTAWSVVDPVDGRTVPVVGEVGGTVAAPYAAVPVSAPKATTAAALSAALAPTHTTVIVLVRRPPPWASCPPQRTLARVGHGRLPPMTQAQAFGPSSLAMRTTR